MKSNKTETVSLTPEELKTQCPDGYDDLIAANAEDPESCSPVNDLTIWKTVKGKRTEFWIQDPKDDGFSNVALMWDGDMWG